MAHPTGVLADGNRVLLGRGAVYFDRHTAAGVKTGERFLGNCSTFELTMSEETSDFYSSVDAASALIAQVSTRRTTELACVMNEFDQFNLGTALMGDSLAIVNGSGTLTSEVLVTTASVQGRWYPATKRNLSGIAVTGPSGTPTHVITTDYLVDAAVGRIYVVEGGGIADGSTIELDATYSAENLAAVAGANAGSVTGNFRFVGDPASGPTVECEIWNAAVHPDGALSLIGSDYAEFRFKAGVLADTTNHPTEPYFRIFVRP